MSCWCSSSGWRAERETETVICASVRALPNEPCYWPQRRGGSPSCRRCTVPEKSSGGPASCWGGVQTLRRAGGSEPNVAFTDLLGIFHLEPPSRWGHICCLCFMRLSFKFAAQQDCLLFWVFYSCSWSELTRSWKVTSHTDLHSWGSWFPSVALKTLQKQKGVSCSRSHLLPPLLAVTHWESPQPGISWQPGFALLALR